MENNEGSKMEECVRCQHEAEIQALKSDSVRNSETHREFYRKFEDLNVKQGVFDNTLSNMMSVLNEIKSDVKGLKEEPSKNYNAIKMCVATALISGVLGYFISFIFK